ncbi:OmpA family protein [Flagellimonas sp.]|uniref:OmpA family protein n=1 Tax=Flagellimonas sp. TaxID=2058762 RepID=UPI003BABD26B
MKKLTLLFFFLGCLGIYAQDLAVSSNDAAIPLYTNSISESNANNADVVKHVDGLSDKKLAKYLRKGGVADKLIEKANEYYDKMWYAESARIYDMVLEKTDAKHTSSLLSKAGDSHYFTGNLEKAYKWYNELYQLFSDDVSDETVFKYTQTLKGTGKYRRAAAITKILRQKREEPLKELQKQNDSNWEDAYTVKIKNLGINSPYSDFSPMFHGNGIVYSSAKDSSIFITRRYKWTNQPFLDIYEAKRKNDEGDLTQPKKFSKSINSKYHEASMAFSPDNETIYFTRNNYGKRLKRGKNGINHLKIYRSRLVNGEWSKAEELPFNSEDYSTGHPTVSPDGTKMYFVSDRPGGFGETDIYVVDIYPDGGFSEPKNLGRTINTAAKEMFPYITENTLYFSSNRPMGFGGLDIYKSEGVEDMFSIGVNLGKPINSSRDDFSYIIDAAGEKGYFASNRKGGKGDDDIYSFVLEANLNAITGFVAEAETEEALERAHIALFSATGALLFETMADTTGGYSFKNLSSNTDYTVVAQKEGYINDSLQVRTKENEGVSVSQYLRQLKRTEPSTVVEMFEPSNVYFEFDSSEITTRSAEELDKLVAVLKENEGLSLKIASHTDARGPAAYNRLLSDRRAKSTKQYIVSQGVDPSRIISAVGYGEERLLNPCSDGVPCSPTQHRLNRRSEFILISE